jgi:uncharacterized membrane protein
MAGAHMF